MVQGPSVRLLNNHSLSLNMEGHILLSAALTDKEKNAMILPGLNSAFLISLEQLCDDECNITLPLDRLLAIKKEKLLLKENRIEKMVFGTFLSLFLPYNTGGL